MVMVVVSLFLFLFHREKKKRRGRGRVVRSLMTLHSPTSSGNLITFFVIVSVWNHDTWILVHPYWVRPDFVDYSVM